MFVPDNVKFPALPSSPRSVVLICPPACSFSVVALTSTAEADTVPYIVMVGARSAMPPDTVVILPPLSSTLVLACRALSASVETEPKTVTLAVFRSPSVTDAKVPCSMPGVIVKPAVPCCVVLTDVEPMIKAPVFCMMTLAVGSIVNSAVAALSVAPCIVTPPVPVEVPFQPM